MIRPSWTICAAGLFAVPALAQSNDAVAEEREAVEAWTACIADEKAGVAKSLLEKDFRSDSYKIGMKQLAKTRVSEGCFKAMPERYRRITLGGLPFAGGLAERLVEQDSAPLGDRLTAASTGVEPATYSLTDAVAMCTVRGAPQHVAILFETKINTGEELKVLAGLQPIVDACTPGERRIEASPMAMRSMLATATFRLLAAQKANTDA